MVSEWLAGSGRALPTQGTSEPLDQELSPLLGGVLLLAELGADGDEAAAALAVHGVHALGRLASGSMHQEVLLRAWLLRDPGPPADTGGSAWTGSTSAGGPVASGQRPAERSLRLGGAASDPHFDGRLAYWQHEQLCAPANGVLDRSFEPERGLRATARTLLSATGDFSRLDEVWADLERHPAGAAAALGRALTPAPEVAVAQPRLTTGSWWSADLDDSLRRVPANPVARGRAHPLAPRFVALGRGGACRTGGGAR